ncbi:MAG: rhamnan synthesis F family protein [Pseudomonadota bacterium]
MKQFCAPVLGGGAILSRGPRQDPDRLSEFILLETFNIGSESLATQSVSDVIFEEDFAARVMERQPDNGVPVETSLRIAVVLHLFYEDLWEEFEGFLRALPVSFTLFLSLRESDQTTQAKALTSFPDALVVNVENTGRDVRPFLDFLWSGALDGFDLVCKLHSKKSTAVGGQEGALGLLWRRRALLDLIGDGRSAAQNIERFQNVAGIGMIGPAQLRLPTVFSPDLEVMKTWPDRVRLAEHAGIEASALAEDFFAGSMFWVRRAALEPLKHLGPDAITWTTEEFQDGENIEHALERFFADSVRGSGFSLVDAAPFLGGDVTRASKAALGLPRRNSAPHALFHDMPEAFENHWDVAPPDALQGQRVALFCAFSPSGHLNTYTEIYLRSLKAAGYFVVLCAVCKSVDPPGHEGFQQHADAIFIRENGGFDFASWSEALRTAPQLWDAERILFANDSVIGPLQGFDRMMTRMQASEADCVALTEHSEVAHHFQSYFFELRSKALHHPGVQDFFGNILCWRVKGEVTRRYEIPLMRHLKDVLGLRVDILFPNASLGGHLSKDGLGNPTLDYWQELLDAGYPFIKTELLRDLSHLNHKKIVRKGVKLGLDRRLLRQHLKRSRRDRGARLKLKRLHRLKAFRRRIMVLLGIRTTKERRQARDGRKGSQVSPRY